MIDALLGWLAALATWSRSAGAAGPAAFAAAYALAALLLIPVWPLTLAAGLVFGPWAGLLVAWPASALGALLAFLTGRRLLRRPLARWLAARPGFAAVEAAVAAEGRRVAFLLRLSPVIPYNLLNYALSVTRLPARDFLVASVAGALPLTLLYTRLGSVLGGTADLAAGRLPAAGPAGAALGWAGLLATGAAVALVARAARRALARRLDGPTGP